MNKLRKILIGLVIFIVLIIAIGYMLPASFTVQRSIVINAKPATLYPYVASLKYGWTQWNPFAEEDTTIVLSYSGPDTGVGAASYWTSKKSGDGSQVITEADTTDGMQSDLAFDHGQYKMHGSVVFTPAQNGGTLVTWTNTGDWGQHHLMFRYAGLMMNKMMGKVLDKGLQTLKTKAEAKN